jgi:hypothetical protein
MTKLAYILAASHSGSTLLTMLLNSHPQIATIGELAPGHIEDLSFYLCSCGSKVRECSFWQAVRSQMQQAGLNFTLEDFGTQFSMPDSRLATRLLRPLHRGIFLELLRDAGLNLFTNWPEKLADIRRTNQTLIQIILKYYNADVFVDKGNRALRLKYLLGCPSLDIKVIHLVRDGRSVALTYIDPAGFADAVDTAKRGGGSGGQRQGERLTMQQAAYQWVRCIHEAENALQRLDKSQWIQVSYEDLCAGTDETLGKIFVFLGLDPAKRIKDFRSVEHHILGNGMRLDTTSQVALDERWKTVLTTADLKTFDNIAGDVSRRYGYE